MSLLHRLKGRVETDLLDFELETMIDAEVAEINDRFGEIVEITITEEGHRHSIGLHRRIDETKTIAIVEISPANTGAAANRTTMSSNDYRITNGGRTIERLIDGTNGAGHWAPLVEFKYTPISDQDRRDETIIKLMQLSITYRGLDKQESVGDHSRTGSVTADAFDREREVLINRLAPRGRMLMA